MLPTITWEVDPVFLKLPREGVAIALGLIAGGSIVYGLARRATDQIVSGLFFAALAAIVAKFMPDDWGIRYYSLLFVFVFLGGHAFLKWQIRRAGGPADDANDFIVYGVLGVLVGARLGHVLFYDLEKALADPIWVFEIWTGGLASHGAVIGLIIAMYLFTKRRGIPFLEGADRFAFSAALGATLVRLGNLLNSEIVGKPTDGTWGFRFPKFDQNVAEVPLRHPSQIYEITLGVVVLGLLLLIDKKLGEEKRPRGVMIASFFALYFTGRFFIEFFKEYEGISPDSPLRMGQILSLPGMLLGYYGVYWSMKNRLPAHWPGAEPLDGDDDEDDDDDEQEEAAGDDEDADEAEDSDEADDDALDDEEDDARKRPTGNRGERERVPVSLDPDIDSEFDAEGKLKRDRENRE